MSRFIALWLSLPLGLLCACSMAAEAESNYVDLWQLQQEARGADPRVLKAQAQVRSGEGRQREALGRMLPQLNANGSVNRSRRDDDLSRTEYNGKRAALALLSEVCRTGTTEPVRIDECPGREQYRSVGALLQRTRRRG